MKKLLLAALLPWLCLAFLQAQNQTLPQKLRHLYDPLDKSQVTTGYLWDQSVCFAHPGDFRGVQDSLAANMDVFGMVYGGLRMAWVGQPGGGLPSPSTYLQRLKAAQGDGPVELALLSLRYDQLRPDAVSAGLVTYQNGQFFNTPTATQSPWLPDTCYLMAPLRASTNSLQPRLVLPAALWYTNLGGPSPVLSLDADDGQGWRTIVPGDTLALQYTRSGAKALRLRLQYPDRVRYARATLEVQGEAVQERFGGMNWPQDLHDIIPVTATKPYLGTAGQGTMHVFYNTSNCNGLKRLLRPLILIEGFEFPGFLAADPQKLFAKLNERVLSNGTENLTDYLYPNEYDIVYVDFANGADYIQRNAYVVEEVIKKVNEMKAAAGSTEQNVVLGVSMGGVAGMYALKDMKLNGPAHDTRLFITYDAPLRGANIPIGTQCLIKFMVDNLSNYADGQVSIPSIDNIWSIIQSPVPRQLLLNHINQVPVMGNGGPNEQAAFLAEMDAMGGLDMRHVALANGAGNGTFLEWPDAVAINPGTPYFELFGKKTICGEWPANSGIFHCGELRFEATLRFTGNNSPTQVFHGYISKSMLRFC